jgi:hypothetical protein
MSLDLLQLNQDMGERNEDDEDDYDEVSYICKLTYIHARVNVYLNMRMII